MILKRSKFSRGSKPSNRNNGRRNGYQRNNYDSKKPNRLRFRGNTNQLLNKYLVLAKNSLSSGDRIQAEYYFQFADHYSRLMSESGLPIKINKFETDKESEKNETINNETIDQKSEENTSIEEHNEEENEEVEDSLHSVSFLSENPEKKI